MSRPLNFLCVSTYFKGEAFLRACKEAGNNVYLLTVPKLEHADWPRESIDDFFFMEVEKNGNWHREDVINGLAYKFRTIHFDRFVALDDFDVEKVALLREYFRSPGMGETTARYFRDKLAMRMKAREEGINVPDFTALFNDDEINAFADSVPTPWLIKPRGEASATGIKKIHSKDDLWRIINELGDKRHRYLVERFTPGDVYHADALTFDGKVQFCRVSQYLDTPFDVAHGGGIFRSHTIEMGSDDDKALQQMNTDVMRAFGMQYSASHTEFIKAHEDGKYYFLETSSRVGGANLAEMVEAATGINLWAEWARLETAKALKKKYKAPKDRKLNAGIVVSLSRFEQPDTSSFTDDELVWRMRKDWHIGLIVQSKKRERILELLDAYTHRIAGEFHASAPAPERPTN
ncbi:ATP-grasp domain-containing protein [Fulvivirga sedimenti]|uniref:ATPase n=1 Tax=Fulvivirga sedimenti TaxID=2879465 RepID=A0A9X1HNY0_9BACT|nr:ATPase [Fulvivirga sedimenti]MCA6075131.1 ATPase [Fulvivirga sedimenti]MCA6076308.1 ATPase [Fulvivirga sedimenti]MCA6077436.1 ATPase [Fulvivirga sedimenti]